MTSIFEPRKNIKPYEYPQLLDYVDAIRHSYWVHTEYNFTSDIQDWNVNMTEEERQIVKKTMLAISQIEVAVKKFWGRIDDVFPKPEISSVGATFAESEVRHQDAYSHLIELLGLNEEFEKLTNISCISKRMDYMEKIMSSEEFTSKIALFSILIEHVSLFSQFYIMMSFNKHKNMLSGISNVVEATSKEENIHGMFGIDLINIINKEIGAQPNDYREFITKVCKEAFSSELEIIDWIFSDGELDYLTKKEVVEFVKSRMNSSLLLIGVDMNMPIDSEEIKKTKRFDDEMSTTKHTDFFAKRSVNYTKKAKSITEDDLF